MGSRFTTVHLSVVLGLLLPFSPTLAGTATLKATSLAAQTTVSARHATARHTRSITIPIKVRSIPAMGFHLNPHHLSLAMRHRLDALLRRWQQPIHIAPTQTASFGIILAVGKHRLVVRQTPFQLTLTKSQLLSMHDRTLLGHDGSVLMVTISPKTRIYAAGGLTGLRCGMSIVIGGIPSGSHTIAAFAIGSLSLGHYVMPQPVEPSSIRWRITHTVVPHSPTRRHVTMHLTIRPVAVQSRERQPLLQAEDSTPPPSSQTLEFGGQGGGPGANTGALDTHDTEIFDFGFGYVTLHQFSADAGLGSFNYDWPFTFTADATAQQPGVPTTLGLSINPAQLPSNPIYPLTVDNTLGFNLQLVFKTHFRSCVTNCDYYHTQNLSAFSTSAQTTDPPPAEGQTLNVPTLSCPSVGVGIPGVPVPGLEIVGIGICNDISFTGSAFSVQNIQIANATVNQTTSPTFDGIHASTINVTPSGTGPMTVELNGFDYEPTLNDSLSFRLIIAKQTVYETPAIHLFSKTFTDITPSFPTDADSGFNNLIKSVSSSGTTYYSQPTDVTLSVPRKPVITSIQPNNSPLCGGETVHIYGTDFEGTNPASSVTFGGENATSFTVNSDSEITAIVPSYQYASGPACTTNSGNTVSVLVTTDGVSNDTTSGSFSTTCHLRRCSRSNPLSPARLAIRVGLQPAVRW